MEHILEGATQHADGPARIYINNGENGKQPYVAVDYEVTAHGLPAEASQLIHDNEARILTKTKGGYVMRPGTPENLGQLRSTRVVFKGTNLDLTVAEALKTALERSPKNQQE